MRSTLLPGLLTSLRHNFNHGIRDVRLFEIGRIFSSFQGGELPDETLALAVVATGSALEEDRAQGERELDFFDLKGSVETAVDWMNLSALQFAPGSARHLRTGQTAVISSGDGKAIGTIGRLAEHVATSYKFRQPVYVLELDLDALLSGPGESDPVFTLTSLSFCKPRHLAACQPRRVARRDLLRRSTTSTWLIAAA